MTSTVELCFARIFWNGLRMKSFPIPSISGEVHCCVEFEACKKCLTINCPQLQHRRHRARRRQVWTRVGRSGPVGSWPGSAQTLGQWCYCELGCLPVTNLPLVSLSCLPGPPLLCLNNHYLFKHSARVGSGLRPAGQEQVPFC